MLNSQIAELGFELTLSYKEGLNPEAVSVFFERFIDEAIESNGLGFIGAEDYGFVCLGKRGSVNADQRTQVEAWLQKGHAELAGSTVSPLIDVWYPENPVNA
ncbi:MULTISPECIES: YggL family protein [unclassified Pseudomonas]|uniref:YggL family protein n=1 Tax=unclassified Pseudomonas TaxID=196821 RepID=UPI002457BD58|nr:MULTISPECIES: YggL family protein [unclassified Pseudomonas]MDH4561093.1 DUF469 family protein [Pseudomonas sp. BN411]MDH4872561.1 DUF469 family protein [Pseudomonas sp. BN515]